MEVLKLRQEGQAPRISVAASDFMMQLSSFLNRETPLFKVVHPSSSSLSFSKPGWTQTVDRRPCGFHTRLSQAMTYAIRCLLAARRPTICIDCQAAMLIIRWNVGIRETIELIQLKEALLNGVWTPT
jgi:hypothetical protein